MWIENIRQRLLAEVGVTSDNRAVEGNIHRRRRSKDRPEDGRPLAGDHAPLPGRSRTPGTFVQRTGQSPARTDFSSTVSEEK